MKKKNWVVVCPACEEEEVVELDDDYTEEELDKKGLLIDMQKRVVKPCVTCLTKVNRRDYP
ncbi:hypothetical protein [Saccharibacillus sp. JS10]|uniref:hypothetical protein n=1 Tax=Saccharibacillus sp. JS10 TaxID=2950552 RepID=UPI0021088105|nr:hypothetical protein [Saccharibacillus sp. JS10]MCQ4085868.1 hypothetical protein [Saccharibacillus sp. JS10]